MNIPFLHRLHRRGTTLLLEVLLVIVFALVLFVPTILFASQFFRLSDQARINFIDFADELNQFGKEGKPGDQTSFLVTLDEHSGFVLFPAKESQWAFTEVMTGSGGSIGSNQVSSIYQLAFPEEQCSGIPCLCLCREYNKDQAIPLSSPEKESGFFNYVEQTNYEISCNKLQCKVLEEARITHPWQLYRASKEEPRRQVILFSKNQEGEIIIEQPPVNPAAGK